MNECSHMHTRRLGFYKQTTHGNNLKEDLLSVYKDLHHTGSRNYNIIEGYIHQVPIL